MALQPWQSNDQLTAHYGSDGY